MTFAPFASLLRFGLALALVLAGCLRLALAQELGTTPPEPPSPTPLSATPASQEEEIELDDEPAPAPPPTCDASLPTGGVAGAWGKQVAPLSICSARLAAKSQYFLAEAVSRSLWCSDPAGAKAKIRASASRKIAAWKAQEAQFEAPAAQDLPQRAANSIWAWAQPPAPKRAPARARQSVPTPFDPSALLPAQWDAREARACSRPLPAELGPSIATYASGKTARCPQAVIVEASLATGRSAGSRFSWVSSPGCLPSPEPSEIAAALAQGAAALQAWQDRQARLSGWEGPPARPAQARSADGR